MHEVVLLQVRQLGEGLWAGCASEGPLPAVGAKVDLEVGELPEHLVARLAPVLDLPVLLLKRERERLVAAAASRGSRSRSGRFLFEVRLAAAGFGLLLLLLLLEKDCRRRRSRGPRRKGSDWGGLLRGHVLHDGGGGEQRRHRAHAQLRPGLWRLRPLRQGRELGSNSH